MPKKICRTCKYWKKSGVRVNANDNLVDVGTCTCNRSPSYGIKTEERDTCSEGDWK